MLGLEAKTISSLSVVDSVLESFEDKDLDSTIKSSPNYFITAFISDSSSTPSLFKSKKLNIIISYWESSLKTQNDKELQNSRKSTFPFPS